MAQAAVMEDYGRPSRENKKAQTEIQLDCARGTPLFCFNRISVILMLPLKDLTDRLANIISCFQISFIFHVAVTNSQSADTLARRHHVLVKEKQP